MVATVLIGNFVRRFGLNGTNFWPSVVDNPVKEAEGGDILTHLSYTSTLP